MFFLLIKHLFGVIFIFGLSISLLAQQPRELNAKFYTGFYYAPSKLTSGASQKMGVLNLESLNWGLGWSTQTGNIHEFSIFGITKKIEDEIVYFEYKKIGLRYEYNFVLKGGASEKLHVYIGGGVGVFYAYHSKEPKDIATFGSHNKVREMIIHAIPRLTYNMNENIFFDFNIPISFFNFGYNTQYSNSPALTPRQRNLGVFEFRSLERVYAFRLGFGYNF